MNRPGTHADQDETSPGEACEDGPPKHVVRGLMGSEAEVIEQSCAWCKQSVCTIQHVVHLPPDPRFCDDSPQNPARAPLVRSVPIRSAWADRARFEPRICVDVIGGHAGTDQMYLRVNRTQSRDRGME